MNFKKTAHRVSVIILFGLLLASCGGETKLDSMFITPVSMSVPVGAAQQYTATGNYSDASSKNITTQVTWTSSNPAAATINSAGYAVAVAPGTTSISAFQGGVASALVTLTVNSATLTAIP